MWIKYRIARLNSVSDILHSIPTFSEFGFLSKHQPKIHRTDYTTKRNTYFHFVWFWSPLIHLFWRPKIASGWRHISDDGPAAQLQSHWSAKDRVRGWKCEKLHFLWGFVLSLQPFDQKPMKKAILKTLGFQGFSSFCSQTRVIHKNTLTVFSGRKGAPPHKSH